MKRHVPWSLPAVELAFGCYFVLVLWLAIRNGRYIALPFIGLFAFGFFFVAFASLRHRPDRGEAAPADEKEGRKEAMREGEA